MTDHQTPFSRTAATWIFRLVSHGLGVSMVAALLWFPFMNRFTFEAIMQSVRNSGFVASTVTGFAVHVLLAACLWALGVILFELITSRRNPKTKTLRLQRGSVMTETLIVLPIFFLLTFGIAQLIINNITGLVANAAAFQAGRTYWLWSAEAAVGRGGVTYAMALEKAHAQAAAVMTPVSPGEFKQSTAGLSAIAQQTRGILMGSQSPTFSADGGQAGMTIADGLAQSNNSKVSGRDFSFAAALGTQSWRTRTARQFTFAYHATSVRELGGGGDEVGIRFVYSHHQVFPLVSHIFGEPDVVGGRAGRYSTITRVFAMPTQIPPNKRKP